MAEKLTIVGSLEPERLYEKGDKFEGEWPLHVTLMPWFSLNGSQPAFEHATGQAVQRFGVQEIVGGKEALFGEDRVRLLGRVANLAGIHYLIMANLARQDGNFETDDDLRHVGDDYVPYVKGLDKSETASFDRLQLVKRVMDREGKDTGVRTVINSFPLLGKKRG